MLTFWLHPWYLLKRIVRVFAWTSLKSRVTSMSNCRIFAVVQSYSLFVCKRVFIIFVKMIFLTSNIHKMLVIMLNAKGRSICPSVRRIGDPCPNGSRYQNTFHIVQYSYISGFRGWKQKFEQYCTITWKWCEILPVSYQFGPPQGSGSARGVMQTCSVL